MIHDPRSNAQRRRKCNGHLIIWCIIYIMANGFRCLLVYDRLFPLCSRHLVSAQEPILSGTVTTTSQSNGEIIIHTEMIIGLYKLWLDRQALANVASTYMETESCLLVDPPIFQFHFDLDMDCFPMSQSDFARSSLSCTFEATRRLPVAGFKVTCKRLRQWRI